MALRNLFNSCWNFVRDLGYSALALVYKLFKVTTIFVGGLLAWFVLGPAMGGLARYLYDIFCASPGPNNADTFLSWLWGGFTYYATDVPNGLLIGDQAYHYGSLILTPLVVAGIPQLFNKLEEWWAQRRLPSEPSVSQDTQLLTRLSDPTFCSDLQEANIQPPQRRFSESQKPTEIPLPSKGRAATLNSEKRPNLSGFFSSSASPSLATASMRETQKNSVSQEKILSPQEREEQEREAQWRKPLTPEELDQRIKMAQEHFKLAQAGSKFSKSYLKKPL